MATVSSFLITLLFLRPPCCLQLDSNAQLENISKLKVYSYQFTDEFAKYAGLPEDSKHATGVLAQDVREVLPDAVTQTHNVTLSTGDVIHDFLVVNKVSCLIHTASVLLSGLGIVLKFLKF